MNDLSFITAFKRFDNFYGAVQRSALFSYGVNSIPVYVPNNEPDVVENCKKFSNVTVLEGIRTARNLGFSNQSPILKDMIKVALENIKTDYVGLINSDIIIPEGFSNKVMDIFNTHGSNAFVVVTRYDTDLFFEIDSVEKLVEFFQQKTTPYDESCSTDLFLAHKNIFYTFIVRMPDLVLGRYAWDNWLHYSAVENGFNCLNGTRILKTYHCSHTHFHILSQEGAAGREAPSSGHNTKMFLDIGNRIGSPIHINSWKYA
jgi:hypothetical protein